ncbi:MAG TPA: phosphoribosyltransferase family protein [Terriglobia bacterium]|nr:phosphoribosyltransferase family protein [Terriglobia bacterium]
MKKLQRRAVRKSRTPKLTPKAAATKARVTPDGNHLRVIFTEKQIRKRVSELAAQVNRDSQGKTLHVIGILENCFLFMADLVRDLTVPVICHFLKAETTDSSSGGVSVREIVYTPRVEVGGKDVLLVDGILQSGVTIDHLVRVMQSQQANSVRIAELIEKTDEKKVDVATAYVGFKTQEKFLVGYGLGFQDKYRNLPHISTLT